MLAFLKNEHTHFCIRYAGFMRTTSLPHSCICYSVCQTFYEIFSSWLNSCYENWCLKICLIYISRQQQSDETPMVWEMLLYMYILYSPDWHYRSTMPIFLFLYGAVFAAVHSVARFEIGFKVHYVILCLLCIPRMYKYYIYTQDLSAKRIAKLYVATLLVGSLCWLCDNVYCEEISSWTVNPQGHALWHLFMGFNSYFANTFLMFCRAQQRGWGPKVVHFMGVLPYVKIEKPKTQWDVWSKWQAYSFGWDIFRVSECKQTTGTIYLFHFVDGPRRSFVSILLDGILS